MVYKNFRVRSTYLADRYLSDWRLVPNMSMTKFMERVKRDGLSDISHWQVYRTKEKAPEKIKRTMVDQYKVPWDYCKELKWTNMGTTTLVEDYAGEFRRLYICLKALEEDSIRGCRRAIGLDACFLKTEQAYAVVDVENGENYKWFLELLKDDLHINNGLHWTFISDKQKGLINAIESLFENAKHRTCIRHQYNNFSISHKGLASKHCHWDAARATTHPTAANPLQRMDQCDMLLNNPCESFNSIVFIAKEKPILSMLEEFRLYSMKRIVACRESANRWTSAVGPRIQKIIDKISELSRLLNIWGMRSPKFATMQALYNMLLTSGQGLVHVMVGSYQESLVAM
ncbi:uncharacterized protein LOC111404832 [Olea europaea var. sylvestris]|uniref:uncharacterized protein LOC111404832 n=1 Tax=Olea europaea var. sylvestris TaxID=158386 RepID=UPI000C1D0A28|nr:uncharacterized protein LOC111404832 [Olea europaea var. sylvestris]